MADRYLLEDASGGYLLEDDSGLLELQGVVASLSAPTLNIETSDAAVSHDIILPPGLIPGGLLIMAVTLANNVTVSVPWGWKELGQGGVAGDLGGGVWYRRIDGTEANDLTWESGSGVQSNTQVWQAFNTHPTIPPEAASTSGTSTSPNAPPITPAGWLPDDVLYLWVYCGDGAPSSSAITAAPPGYGGLTNEGGTGGNAVTQASAWRAITGSYSENPDAGVVLSNQQHFVAIIAIPPADAISTTPSQGYAPDDSYVLEDGSGGYLVEDDSGLLGLEPTIIFDPGNSYLLEDGSGGLLAENDDNLQPEAVIEYASGDTIFLEDWTGQLLLEDASGGFQLEPQVAGSGPIILEVGQIAEAETIPAATLRKILGTAQIVETETAQALALRKLANVGQVVEAELAQPANFQPNRVVVSQVVETETVQPATLRKLLRPAQVAEAETVQAATLRKIVRPGLLVETELIQLLKLSKRVPVGLTSEIETVQATKLVKRLTLGQTVESETTQALKLIKLARTGLIGETELVQTLKLLKLAKVAQVQEFELVQGLTGAGGVLNVGQVIETETVQSAKLIKIVRPGLLTEAELAQPLTLRKIVRPAQIVETELAQPLKLLRLLRVGQIAEAELARPVTLTKLLRPGLLIELEEILAATLSGILTDPLPLFVATPLGPRFAAGIGQSRYDATPQAPRWETGPGEPPRWEPGEGQGRWTVEPLEPGGQP